MKIAHFIPVLFDKMGGLQVCVHNVCEQLAKKGHDVTLYCPSFKKMPDKISYKIKKFPRLHVHWRLFSISKYFVSRHVNKLQNEHRYDLWQINAGYPYGAMLADYFNKKGIPSVLRCCGVDIQIDESVKYGVRRNPNIDKVIRDAYKKYTSCIAVSKSVYDEYKIMGISDENIYTIPNGVDLERMSNVELQSINIREKYKIPHSARILLTVGRNHPKKGYDKIPYVLRKLIDLGHDVYWIIVGKDCKNIKAFSNVESINKHLITVEELSPTSADAIPSDNLIDYYRQADLFVMLSKVEGFPIVVIEAMAAGLPIAGFNAPGVNDVVNDNCGILVDFGEDDRLIQEIERIIKCDDIRINMSTHCMYHAKQYSWNSIADIYLRMYNQVIANS